MTINQTAGVVLAGGESSAVARTGPRVGYQVICICGGFGFPYGVGNAPRILNVGKALLKAGVEFSVLHCGPSPIAANKTASGVYEGIRYEYTTPTMKRPDNALMRFLLYVCCACLLVSRLIALRSERRRTTVYIFIQHGPTGLIAAAACKLLGIPVVQEVNEWWPGTGNAEDSRFTSWLYNGPMFSLATGAIVISSLIEERARAASQRLKRKLIVQRTPILVDINKFHTEKNIRDSRNAETPQFVWCGGVDGYVKDIEFLIRALAQVFKTGMNCRLAIVGGASENVRRRIMQYAKSHGLGGAVAIQGFVEEERLDEIYQPAAGLLLPLFDDDRSRTRMPTKLGGYLASGIPVITCAVGDLTELLSHGWNAYIGPPGDEAAFAQNMCSVLRDPATARKIGAAGRRACEAEIHYEAHSARLADFFAACIQDTQK